MTVRCIIDGSGLIATASGFFTDGPAFVLPSRHGVCTTGASKYSLHPPGDNSISISANDCTCKLNCLRLFYKGTGSVQGSFSRRMTRGVQDCYMETTVLDHYMEAGALRHMHLS